MINLIKRYRYFSAMVLMNLVLLWLNLQVGLKSFKISADNLLEVFLIMRLFLFSSACWIFG